MPRHAKAMKRRSTLGLIAMLVLAGLGAWIFFGKGDGRIRAQPEPQPQAVAIPQAQPATRGEPTAGQAVARDSTTPTMATSTGDALIQTLAKSYQSGALPVRIRLQDQLSRHWDENPPAAAELLALVGDRSLPAEMRTYLARTFANRVRVQAYSEGEQEAALAQMRALVSSEAEDAVLRADLANVLTTIDPSDEAVKAVTPLLSQSDTQAVIKAVNALSKTTNPLAIEAAYEFAQNDEALLKSNPTALLAALAPLSTTDKDVTPMLNRIIQQTDDFKLYAGAVQCLIHAKPTPAVLDSIATAYAATQRFPQYTEQARHLCRAAAQKHAHLFRANPSAVKAVSASTLESLLNLEDKK